MRVSRTTYKDCKGKTKKAARWYVEFRDHLGTVRRLPAFTGKAATEELGRNLEKLVAYHKGSGGQLGPALADWLAGLAAKTCEKLLSIGLLDRERVAKAKSLTEHLGGWAQSLRAKGTSEQYIDILARRVRRVFDGCGFRYYGDIRASKVQSVLHDLQAGEEGIAHQTFNFYLAGLSDSAGG